MDYGYTQEMTVRTMLASDVELSARLQHIMTRPESDKAAWSEFDVVWEERRYRRDTQD